MNQQSNRFLCTAVSAALAWALPTAGIAQSTQTQLALTDVKTLDRVNVTANRPASMPLEIPTTLMSLTRRDIEQTLNATDAEDALKYFPSLLVRKRYIGDYDHAVLSTRASGTGNSARSLVYADGVLLSNLLGNGASFTPRWALVTPEEIERVDVLYGPFSAAYAGNSAGAIVDFVTRMPKAFEAHMKLNGFTQDFRLYGTDARYSGGQGSASVGSRSGDWSWWVNVNRLDSNGQPIAFSNKLVSAGTAGNAGAAVSGAVPGNNPRDAPWVLFGATSQTHTVQDHAKLKLAYDITPALRASYTLGYWSNKSDRRAETFLRDAAGNPVYSGVVNVAGRNYTLGAADLAPSKANLEHLAHGLNVKSHTRGNWDWEVAASAYDYSRDQVRAPTVVMPAALSGGAGRITDLNGTGWNTFALKGVWRPAGAQGEHVVEAGLQRDAFQLRSQVSNTADWISGAAGATPAPSTFSGNTKLQSLWAQDAWRFASDWKAVLGGRLEHWQAFNGAINGLPLGERSESHFSPKAAVSFEAQPAVDPEGLARPCGAHAHGVGALPGRGVSERDCQQRPEPEAGEVLDKRTVGRARARIRHPARDAVRRAHRGRALFADQRDRVAQRHEHPERRHDSNPGCGSRPAGERRLAEGPGRERQRDLRRLDHHAKRQIPRQRGSMAATRAAVARHCAGELRARRPMVGQLRCEVQRPPIRAARQLRHQQLCLHRLQPLLHHRVRLRYRVNRHWVASVGIDNLGNSTYSAFHPYPQRTFLAESGTTIDAALWAPEFQPR